MTLILGVVTFGIAICAYVVHQVRNAPFAIEVNGRLFITEDSAAPAPVASANLVPATA